MRVKAKSFQTIILPVLLVFGLVDPVPGQTTQKREPFTFTKVDLDLLEQSNLLDQNLERDGLIYVDEALNAYIDRVGRSLLPTGAPLERVQWRFRALRDPLANAFALPNGSIYVNTGLLSLLENEDQLASVLAHEITHVHNRHSYMAQRSYRKKMVAMHIFAAAGALVPAIGVVGTTISVIARIAPSILAATIHGYSRELEKEADIYAVDRLTETDYDPREMVNTFKLLQKSFEVELVKVYYTDHPKLQDRITYVSELAQAKPPRAASEHSRNRYLSSIEKVARHNTQLDIESGRFRTAIVLSQKLVNFNPKSSESLVCLAESYRALGPRSPEPNVEELSSKAKKEARKLKQKMTLEEEENFLMAVPSGESAWKANQVKAEELYQKALDLDSANAGAHRGLGLLFEKAGKYQQAMGEYRKYLELQPGATDRLRILRRLEALEKSVRSTGQ